MTFTEQICLMQQEKNLDSICHLQAVRMCLRSDAALLEVLSPL